MNAEVFYKHNVPTAFKYAVEAGATNGEALRFSEWKEAHIPNVGILEAWHAWVDATPARFVGTEV